MYLRKFKTRKKSILIQTCISLLIVVLVSTVCFILAKFIDYKVTALLLLMAVSLIAILFDIIPVLLSAIWTALLLNFFFIQPLFTFHITNSEDILMFLMYFIIALVNAVLTFKIREVENKARDQAEKENTIQLYSTLLNSLSHELRTPIATIIGAIDTLKENKTKLSNQHQTELLEEIDKASIRLNRQVENLLNMSRLETALLKPKLDWCDMNELVCSLLPSTKSPIFEFLPVDHLPLFKLDSGLIEEVIQNLIHNAIQYTPEGTLVNIEVKQESGSCVILISDNGQGFPADEIEFVFDKFYRLANTKTGGSGLGLSIAKGFVTAHKGQIHLENNNSGGAKFTIIIPAETSYLKNIKNE